MTLARVSPKKKKEREIVKNIKEERQKCSFDLRGGGEKSYGYLTGDFPRKLEGNWRGFFPRYEISSFSFFCFFRESQKKAKNFPFDQKLTLLTPILQAEEEQRGKKALRYYCQGNGARSSWRGKEKAYFRVFDQSDGAWRSHCQIYHRRSIRQKKSGGENNNNNNNISIHSFDLGKSKQDFPGRNSVLRNSVARTILKNISKISTVPHLFHI